MFVDPSAVAPKVLQVSGVTKDRLCITKSVLPYKKDPPPCTNERAKGSHALLLPYHSREVGHLGEPLQI